MKPLHRISFEEAHCASCDELLQLTTFDRITSNASDVLEQTLSSLGIPPLEILRAQTPDWRTQYLELTGDSVDFPFSI